MQHKYWSYLQTSPSANKTVFILYSFLYPAQHFTLLIGWPVRLYVCIEPCPHEQLCICIIRWLSIMPTECCPPRRYQSLPSLLVPWTPLFHEQLCHEEAGYLRRSYLCRTDPPRQHSVLGSATSLFKWADKNAVVSTLLTFTCSVICIRSGRVMGPTLWCVLTKGKWLSLTSKAWHLGDGWELQKDLCLTISPKKQVKGMKKRVLEGNQSWRGALRQEGREGEGYMLFFLSFLCPGLSKKRVLHLRLHLHLWFFTSGIWSFLAR